MIVLSHGGALTRLYEHPSFRSRSENRETLKSIPPLSFLKEHLNILAPAVFSWLALFLYPLKRFSTIAAYHVELPCCPDDGAAAGANIFDAAVDGFLAASLGGSLYWLAAGVDSILAQGFLDPCFPLRGQRRYCPAIFVVLLNVQAVSLGGGFEFQVMVIHFHRNTR